MNQVDWVGSAALPKPFRDIRNQRDSVAEEKARLSLELHDLLARVPMVAKNGSVNAVREWKATHTECKKVVESSRSSVHELRSAINRMRRFSEAA